MNIGVLVLGITVLGFVIGVPVYAKDTLEVTVATAPMPNASGYQPTVLLLQDATSMTQIPQPATFLAQPSVYTDSQGRKRFVVKDYARLCKPEDLQHKF